MNIVKALKKGTILHGAHDEYVIDSVLGTGSFGITYKAKCKVKIEHVTHTVYYAIKEFFMSSICSRLDDGTVFVNESQKTKYEYHRKAFVREASMLYELPPHDGIVKVNEYFNALNTTYYVMEFLDEPLSERVKSTDDGKLSEKQALSFFTKVASSTLFLHDNNRLHLDIKPGNIMIKDGEPKLIDFGQSRVFDEYGMLINNDADNVCSDGYSPVEQYNTITRFSPSVDIYALGATLFYMLTGENPIKAQELDVAYVKGKLPQNISDETQQMILGALARTEEARYKSIRDMLSVIGVIISDNDGSETRALNEPSRPNPVIKKGVKTSALVALSAFVVLVIIWGINKCGDFPDTPTGETPSSAPVAPDSVKKTDTEERTKIDTVATAETSTTPEPKIVEPSAAKDPVVHPVAPPKPVSVTPPSKPTLDYASWTGRIVNGKPDGEGTMTFTRSCVIPGSSFSVGVGDVFKGSFHKGRIVNGYLNGKYVEVED